MAGLFFKCLSLRGVTTVLNLMMSRPWQASQGLSGCHHFPKQITSSSRCLQGCNMLDLLPTNRNLQFCFVGFLGKLVGASNVPFLWELLFWVMWIPCNATSCWEMRLSFTKSSGKKVVVEFSLQKEQQSPASPGPFAKMATQKSAAFTEFSHPQKYFCQVWGIF